MRRLLATVLAAAAIVGAAMAPAQAGPPTRYKSSSASANAFWYDITPLEGESYRQHVWYVGVYQSTDGTWSDLYEEVAVCEPVEEEGEEYIFCDVESFRIGFSDLSEGTFVIDRKKLTSAYLNETYDLQEYGSDWEPVGDPVPTHIETWWEGLGKASTEGGMFRWRSECYQVHSRFKGAFRQAEAFAAIDGEDIGETYDAFLSSGSSIFLERTC